MAGDHNDEVSFPNMLLLPDTQVSRTHKAFANGSSASIKLSRTELSKMMQFREFSMESLGSPNAFKVMAKSFVYGATKVQKIICATSVIRIKQIDKSMDSNITLKQWDKRH